MSCQANKRLECSVCKKLKSASYLVRLGGVDASFFSMIQKKYSQLSGCSYICIDDLIELKKEYIYSLQVLHEQAWSNLEQIFEKMKKEQSEVPQQMTRAFELKVRLRDRMADAIASFCGSWAFLIVFSASIFVWIGINSIAMWWRIFDPYPFIFLNLIFSFVAALQAPIIMMSQNRQDAKDRVRAEHDFLMSFKAQHELMYLHAKMDELMRHQREMMTRIQMDQVELAARAAAAKEETNEN